MLDLRRVGLFLRDDEQDYPTVGLEKAWGRANIHLVVDAVSQLAHDLDLLIALEAMELFSSFNSLSGRTRIGC